MFSNFCNVSIFKTPVIDWLNKFINVYMQSVMVRCLVKIAKSYVGSASTMNSAIILMEAVWMDVILSIMELPVLKEQVSDQNKHTFSVFSFLIQAYLYPLNLTTGKE